MRILALVTDAFGGHGGIALYNRNVVGALCAHPSRPEVTAIPRLVPFPVGPLPTNLRYPTWCRDSKAAFCAATLHALSRSRRVDLIVCSHIHLLPVAELARRWSGARVVVFVYGIEAWTATRSRLANLLVRTVDAVVSIRQLTATRLHQWSGLNGVPTYILENAIDIDRYGVKPRNPALVARYNLAGKKVVLTMARVEEQRKGFDEVLEVLPALARDIPSIAYLIVGGGHDLPRLRGKAKALGVADRVVFTGTIPESEKADHLRLADVFAMPGSGASFDRYPLRFVLLEAMACGVPVVASVPDGDGESAASLDLPTIEVDPRNPDAIRAGIKEALARGTRVIPEALTHYGQEAFAHRLHSIVDELLRRPKSARARD